MGLNGTSPSSSPGNVRQRGGFGKPAAQPHDSATGPVASSCAPPLLVSAARRAARLRFRLRPLADNIAASRKSNAVSRLAWQAHPDHLAFAEGSYYRGEFTYKSSPSPVVVADPFNNPIRCGRLRALLSRRMGVEPARAAIRTCRCN
ncbi:MAG: hypothetical protein IPJ28_14070 [Betaproteobacteria bacterium]|nr:hypothetical protein [Betaproteobacteria bacterium]